MGRLTEAYWAMNADPKQLQDRKADYFSRLTTSKDSPTWESVKKLRRELGWYKK